MTATWSQRLTTAADHFNGSKRLSIVDWAGGQIEGDDRLDAAMAAWFRAEAVGAVQLERSGLMNDDGDIEAYSGEAMLALVKVIEEATR
jgi:hypothetical protein